MKKFFAVGFLFLVAKCYGQYDTAKVDEIAKAIIYLDRIDRKISDSVFILMLEGRALKIRELEQFGFDNTIIFLKVVDAFDDLKNFQLTSRCDTSFVFAVNRKSYHFYRIKGFYQNDLMHLLKSDWTREKFARLRVESLDLKCMVEGLKMPLFEQLSNPCLFPCNEGVIIE